MDFMGEIIDDVPIVSVITKIEVLGFDAPDEDYQLLTNFMNDALVLNLNRGIVEKTIAIRKEQKVKLPDAIIAATALDNELTLITRNTKDFKNINGLVVINPHDGVRKI